MSVENELDEPHFDSEHVAGFVDGGVCGNADNDLRSCDVPCVPVVVPVRFDCQNNALRAALHATRQ